MLVTVLFARTLPLIRYEMTDSIRLSTDHGCPCGRPYALLDGIQGREQEALHFPTGSGLTRVVQPVVFHHVMDQVTAAGWQIVQQSDGLDVLLAGSRGMEPSVLVARLQTALAEQGVTVPEIRIEEVAAIPRTALGKAPLITTAITRSMGPPSAHGEPDMSG